LWSFVHWRCRSLRWDIAALCNVHPGATARVKTQPKHGACFPSASPLASRTMEQASFAPSMLRGCGKRRANGMEPSYPCRQLDPQERIGQSLRRFLAPIKNQRRVAFQSTVPRPRGRRLRPGVRRRLQKRLPESHRPLRLADRRRRPLGCARPPDSVSPSCRGR